jgi:16S rRNA (guanine1516-N2)-methyltransferase
MQCEFSQIPVIAALLRDGLERAANESQLEDIVGRMRLVEGDSVTALLAMAKAGEHPDVVLLDPMFPERRKSASVKKKLQLLQRLERPCEDEKALLDAALAACPRKVVIKRPPKGPFLAGVKPSYSLQGKAVRFDCIVPVQIGASLPPDGA